MISMSASLGIADFAKAKYFESISTPTLLSPKHFAAAMVDPAPINGSKIIPVPRGNEARTN
jgi:hypothetical protein